MPASDNASLGEALIEALMDEYKGALSTPT